MAQRLAQVLTLVLAFTIPAMAADPAEVVDIGSRRELFVDRYLIEELDNVRLQMHRPQPREVAIVHDAPWEGTGSGYHSVFKDGDKYRMYYKAWHLDVQPDKFQARSRLFCCYAESDDGIQWRKPDLGLHDFDGSTSNNIVMVAETYGDSVSDPGHCAVFKDDNPDAADDARYKAIIRARQPHGLMVFKSADGLRWTPIRNQPVITHGAFDSQNLAFWDSSAGRYRAYWRYFTKGVTSGDQWKPGGVRAIRTATSDDLLSWQDEADLTYVDSPTEQLYTNQIKPYHRAPQILIGFPTRYVDRGWSDSMRKLPDLQRRQWRARASQRYGTALTEALLMSSRNGVKFDRWNEAFLRPGAENPQTWHYGQQYIAWHAVETASALAGAPNELSLYATEGYWHGKGSQLRRYTLRLDGFVSASAPWKGGRLLTRSLTFDGESLEVNFSTSAAGSLRVELQDTDGKPIEGFSLADCPEIFGDSLNRTVSWKTDRALSALAGKPIRLLFELKDGDLYSFRFVSKADHLSAAISLDAETRQRCLAVLRQGLRSDEFWPAIHAAEALTLAGHGDEVRTFLKPKLETESDDQRRCGLARELVRAGDLAQNDLLLDVLQSEDPHGHVHAAESLYKVGWRGDSEALLQVFRQTENIRLKIMAAAALAKHGKAETKAEAFTFLRLTLRQEVDSDIYRIAAWVIARVGSKRDIALIRARLEETDDPLALAFLQHALGALGDPQGRQALIRNLDSSDSAIRTYAAVFSGESGLAEAVPSLTRQLEDEHLDARIRAAQALLVLAE